MNQSIVCLTYSEIENQMPFITNSYNNGKYVHFLNLTHQNMNCPFIENTIIIFIPVELKQAANIIINQYNYHFCVNEDDDDDDDNDEDDGDEDDDDDNDEDDGDEDDAAIDPIIAFTCPACSVLTL